MIDRLTIRKVDIGTNVALIVFAGLVMIEGYKLGSGWGPSGPRPGFFPFSVALMMAMGALIALVQAWRSEEGLTFFECREEIDGLLKTGIPAALAIVAIPFLGLYLASFAYLFLFAAWHGGLRWYSALFISVACTASLFLLLDWGFNIPMPKSPFYGHYFPI
jgi:putative tricarboxylic transport membrane protein